MSTRRQHNRLDDVEEQANVGKDIQRHVAQLLPDDYPEEPEPPDIWKDEEAMEAWINGLPDNHEVIVLNVVQTPPEEREFENEVRPPKS